MRKFLQITLAVVAATLMASCVTQKQMTYVSNAKPEMEDSINAKFQSQAELTIRIGDALTIYVSALDLEAVVPYNLPAVVFATPGTTALSTTPALQYYIVDENGDIDFPVLGKLHVAGLKRNEVENLVKEKLEAQVLNPQVHAHIVNAKVAVLGEVNRPGNVGMAGGRLTLLEALAAAGDLTPYGRRDNVLVTREVDGKLQIARLNLRDANIFTSPYFFLQQNDVVYVSPNKVRVVNSANTSLWLSLVSTLASAATVVVTVVTAARK
jgi:polysaccharide export outer membrane protein